MSEVPLYSGRMPRAIVVLVGGYFLVSKVPLRGQQLPFMMNE